MKKATTYTCIFQMKNCQEHWYFLNLVEVFHSKAHLATSKEEMNRYQTEYVRIR